jgi:predicted nucleic acid-binding protein
VTRGLLDTSVFIAREQARPLGPLPAQVAISVVTIGELELGVHAATDPDVRARRADTLALARAADPLPVTETVMSRFAQLVHACRSNGSRPKVLDTLIAATALDHGLTVLTQDRDFEALASAQPALGVLRV